MPDQSRSLIGTWRLDRWDTIYEDGRTIQPMGADAQGLLIYTADGFMSAALFRHDRPAFVSGESLTASAEEKIRAWDSHLSYAGRYDVAGDVVRHYVEASQYPNWLGTTLIRTMHWEGDRLALRTPPQVTRRGRQESVLTWRRAAL